MPKSLSLFCGRQSQYGDIVAYLPFLNYLEQQFANSYKIYSLAKKCSQIAPLLINHPNIDRIQITEKDEGWSNNDVALAKTCDRIFNPNPPLTDQQYYNSRSLVKETFFMNQVWYQEGWNNGFDEDEWNQLSPSDKMPKLSQWFDVNKKEKSIGILPFAGYTNLTKGRSPSVEWWDQMLPMLTDYNVYQFGHPSSVKIQGVNHLTDLNFFDTVKELLGCDLILGSDSGLQWIIGAYGHPQIILYTNYIDGHVSNYDAFVPPNHKGNASMFFGLNDINTIKQEEVLEKVKEIL